MAFVTPRDCQPAVECCTTRGDEFGPRVLPVVRVVREDLVQGYERVEPGLLQPLILKAPSEGIALSEHLSDGIAGLVPPVCVGSVV
jgi:hypothetical protein